MTTTTLALSITLVLATRTALADDGDDWSAGFDDAADTESVSKQAEAWALTPEASLLVQGFTYLQKSPDHDQRSPARYAVDARVQVEAKSEASAVRIALLFRRDLGDHTRDRVDAEEAYVDFGSGTSRIRVGRTLLRWGVSNIYKPSDVINPTDYTDFLEFEKRGSYALWARRMFGGSFLELFYLPVPEPDIIPLPDAVAPDGTLVSDNRWVRGMLPAQMAGVPVRSRFADPEPRTPSAAHTQVAVRASRTVANVELSLGYAYVFDHIPVLVPNVTPGDDHLDIEFLPRFRRRHFGVLGIARSFGKSRLALDASVSVPKSLPDDSAEATTDDGFATAVLSYDHTTGELRPNQTIQVAVDVTTTQPLKGRLPLDDISRLRYPFPLAALARISYHAGSDRHYHLELIESFEGFGFGRLDPSGAKAAFIVQPKFEMTYASYVQLEVGATFLLGRDSTLFGRYRRNSRVFWSAKTSF